MIDLKKAVTSFAEHRVDYVIVGGVAIALHSSGYITHDLDICYSRTKENISRLVQALGRFDPRPRDWPMDLRFFFDESTIRNGTNFTFETSIGAVDLLGEVKGIGSYRQALQNSLVYTIYGVEVNAFDLNALIVSKTAADRPKDHLVLPELLALEEALDPNEE
jgi:hypothetical protein